jgi:hypothetical protein
MYRLESIFIIGFISLWLPGYFGLFSPYVEGSYQNVPYWVNVLALIISISVIGLTIISLSFYLKINDSGISQKTFRTWTVKWQEIVGWGYSLDSNGNSLFLELTPDRKKKEVLSGFLTKKNLHLIKSELERRIGQPLRSTE